MTFGVNKFLISERAFTFDVQFEIWSLSLLYEDPRNNQANQSNYTVISIEPFMFSNHSFKREKPQNSLFLLHLCLCQNQLWNTHTTTMPRPYKCQIE